MLGRKKNVINQNRMWVENGLFDNYLKAPKLFEN